MPLRWTLELAEEPKRPLTWRFDVLHAIACRFFAEQEDRHAANDKSFSVSLADSRRSLRLIWLDDRTDPPVEPPEKVQVGDEEIAVASAKPDRVGYEEIEQSPAATGLRFTVVTPALFRHNGYTYPLPDPYVTFASLARRHRTYRPGGELSDDAIRDLGRAVRVTRHRIRTQRFSWHGHTDSGFTGEVEFGLAPSAPAELRRAFTTLGAFAELAGIGRGTTHGLGATFVNTIDPRR
jgi:hypothetical protein